MKQFEIKSFINLNSEDKLLEAYKTVYDKNKEINKRRNQLILLMLVSVAFYFITKKSAISNIQLGPISLNDYSLIEILIPGSFSYLFYEFILISSHQIETARVLKTMNLALFKYSTLLKIKRKESHLLYLLLPYSPFTEINRRMMDRERFNLLEKIFISPVFLIALLPLYFGFISIKYVYVHYWNTLIGKISVIFSSWMFIIIAMLTISKIITGNKKKQAGPDKNNDLLKEVPGNPAPDQNQI